ncbi:unnamed protein product [Closterium sp. NIES-54]
MQELRWLTYLLTGLGEQRRSPPVMYVDNKAMIALCQEHITKHIALRYFLARELQQRGQLRLAYVATRANTADIFTKALPPVKGLRIKGEPKEVGSCENCLTSKFSRFPFHSTVGQSSDPVELVHVDLVGPMKVKGDGGALYSMIMVDDYTRLTWSFPLAKKSDAARVIIEEWLPMVERESGKRVKAIRSNRGGEFLGAEFRSWLKRHGIKQQLTTAYTPQSNGVAERANRTIIEGGRTILVDSGLPLRFWPLAIRHATVIKNRVFTEFQDNPASEQHVTAVERTENETRSTGGQVGLYHPLFEKCGLPGSSLQEGASGKTS